MSAYQLFIHQESSPGLWELCETTSGAGVNRSIPFDLPVPPAPVIKATPGNLDDAMLRYVNMNST